MVFYAKTTDNHWWNILGAFPTAPVSHQLHYDDRLTSLLGFPQLPAAAEWISAVSILLYLTAHFLTRTFIKKKKDAIHASRGGWMEAVFADLHRCSPDMQNSSSQRSERSARGKTRQDCDSAIKKLVAWARLMFRLVRLLLEKNTENLCRLLESLPPT